MNGVIYARYSSNAQTEQSIEGQLHDCYAFAQRFGINIVGEYIDRAITGRTDERPSFQRMISDSAFHTFDRVIVWKFDRFARNRYDSAIYKQQLKKNGVRVMSAMENLGEGDESILMEAMLEALAEYYSLDLRKKIKRGIRESVSKKQYRGGRLPIGYKAIDKKIVFDEKYAPIIQEVFRRYADGESMVDIVNDLNKRGVSTRDGKPLTKTTFTRALSNRAYIGLYDFNGEVIEGMFEPMIDQQTFNKAQVRTKANKHNAAASTANVDYILSGKVFCGHCGQPMTGECGRSKNGIMYHYYACSKRKHGGKCDKHAERKDDLQQYVLEKTINFVLQQENLQRFTHMIVQQYEREFDPKPMRDIEHRMDAIDRELNNLIDALAEAPKIAHDRIYKKMQNLESEHNYLETELSKLRIASSIKPSYDQVYSWLISFTHGDPSDTNFCHDIISSFVNSVFVYDDRITIFYNHSESTNTVTHAQLSSECSTSDAFAPHHASEVEHKVIFVNRVFGILFRR